MRICFTSDLHGDAGLYAQLDALLLRERPDVLILGGDMFPDGDPPETPDAQLAYIDTTFRRALRAWRSGLPGLTIAGIVGNHDWLCAHEALQRLHAVGEFTLLSLREPTRIRDTTFLGFSHTPPTPFWLKDFERLDLEADTPPPTGGTRWNQASGRPVRATPQECYAAHECLQRLLDPVRVPTEPWIFVSHGPPHETNLDRLPTVPHPVGSRAIRRFIERHQPLCALHGHIHESPQVTGRCSDRLGRTLCVNPGQAAQLHAVLFQSADPAGTLRHTVLA